MNEELQLGWEIVMNDIRLFKVKERLSLPTKEYRYLLLQDQ